MPSLTTILAALGALTLFRLTYSFLSFLYENIRTSSLSRYNHSNAYALITGASDGIGLGFAHELLANGFNIILHGRNESKLKGIQSDLQKQYPSKEVKYYVADAARTGPDAKNAMSAMLSQFGDLPITILINNVGGMAGVDPLFDALEKRTPEQVEHVIAMNSIYPTQMTRALLPILQKNSPSLIMNISSLAAVVPIPYGSIYNGAKSYLGHWSHSMTLEMRALKRDVEVLLMEVGMVVTPGNLVANSENLFTPGARHMAKSALQKVGCGKWKVVGYWGHALQKNSLYWLPEPVMQMVCVLVGNQMKTDLEEKAREGDVSV